MADNIKKFTQNVNELETKLNSQAQNPLRIIQVNLNNEIEYEGNVPKTVPYLDESMNKTVGDTTNIVKFVKDMARAVNLTSLGSSLGTKTKNQILDMRSVDGHTPLFSEEEKSQLQSPLAIKQALLFKLNNLLQIAHTQWDTEYEKYKTRFGNAQTNLTRIASRSKEVKEKTALLTSASRKSKFTPSRSISKFAPSEKKNVPFSQVPMSTGNFGVLPPTATPFLQLPEKQPTFEFHETKVEPKTEPTKIEVETVPALVSQEPAQEEKGKEREPSSIPVLEVQTPAVVSLPSSLPAITDSPTETKTLAQEEKKDETKPTEAPVLQTETKEQAVYAGQKRGLSTDENTIGSKGRRVLGARLKRPRLIEQEIEEEEEENDNSDTNSMTSSESVMIKGASSPEIIEKQLSQKDVQALCVVNNSKLRQLQTHLLYLQEEQKLGVEVQTCLNPDVFSLAQKVDEQQKYTSELCEAFRSMQDQHQSFITVYYWTPLSSESKTNAIEHNHPSLTRQDAIQAANQYLSALEDRRQGISRKVFQIVADQWVDEKFDYGCAQGSKKLEIHTLDLKLPQLEEQQDEIHFIDQTFVLIAHPWLAEHFQSDSYKTFLQRRNLPDTTSSRYYFIEYQCAELVTKWSKAFKDLRASQLDILPVYSQNVYCITPEKSGSYGLTVAMFHYENEMAEQAKRGELVEFIQSLQDKL